MLLPVTSIFNKFPKVDQSKILSIGLVLSIDNNYGIYFKMDSWFQDTRVALEAKISLDPAPNGCRLWMGLKRSTGIPYGRSFYKLPSSRSQREVPAHRLVYAIWNKLLPGDLPLDLECSHLCHEPTCVNVKHLVMEAGAINKSRKVCHYLSQCVGHHGHLPCIFPEK